MSAGTAQAPLHSGPGRRRAPRYPLAIPVDVTVLRSGILQSIPGRSCDLGLGGLGVALPAELQPGDVVAAEFRLPDVKAALQVEAIVRHQTRLRCGLEFRELSQEHQGMIRYWIRRAARGSHRASYPGESPSSPTQAAESSAATGKGRTTLRRVMWLLLAVCLAASAVGWWRWHRAWEELESGLPAERRPLLQHARTQVAADVMRRLLTYQVAPEYPEAARQANVQGTVVLSAVIGRDGTVHDLRPLSGAEVLRPAALEAVRWWRFQPYRINGEAVEVETTVAIEFHND